MDDYNHYQRPCSNGIGYVSICPGEPGNNFYSKLFKEEIRKSQVFELNSRQLMRCRNINIGWYNMRCIPLYLYKR